MELRQRAFSPFSLPNAGAERVLSLYQRAVRAARVEKGMLTNVTASAPFRWLAKWSVRSFFSPSFPSRSSRLFQLKRVPPLTTAVPCRSLRVCRTALQQGEGVTEAGLILRSGWCSVKYPLLAAVSVVLNSSASQK